MIQINHMAAILVKDIKDVLRNIQVLILFIIYPVVALIMTQSIGEEKGFFIGVFATMHFVFTPIVVAASMIAEEKEKNTLRVLRMSGISSLEFFLSTAVFVVALDCLAASSFIFMSGDSSINTGLFYSAAIFGNVISVLIGMCVGTYSKSPSATNGLAVPLGMIFSFLPMLSYFNKNLESISKYLFGQQIQYLISGQKLTAETIIICSINFIIVTGIYILLYRKAKTDE